MSDLILSRMHRILSARNSQISNNIAAWKGGKQYVNLRLHRAPNESDLSWDGDGVTLPGRKNRAYLINDAGRVVQKINQYLFAEYATRDGIDTDWAKNVTKTGLSIRQYWESASEYLTTGQWVWLSVDRGAPEIDPETGRPRTKSMAEKHIAGDTVYWSIWPATSIVDWSFDDNGKLIWLLTSELRYNNSNPLTEATETELRTLWEAGRSNCTWKQFSKINGKSVMIKQGMISIPDVPFVCLGVPSVDPWWFDDVEMVQAAEMNLESLHYENLVKTVYPQLVIPEGMAASLEAKVVEQYGTSRGKRIVEIVKELVRGLDRPFIESPEDSGLTRYLQPNAQDLKAIPEHVDRIRKQLFDMVGLALFNRETRQVQSSESKQFDHLDTESTLQNRALLLQETEKKMVELSKKLDVEFAEYEPVWPSEFNVPNTKDDVASIVQLANFAELPPSMSKQVMITALKLLDEINHIPADIRQTIIDEINNMTIDQGQSQNADDERIKTLTLQRERALKAGDKETADKLAVEIKSIIDAAN